MPQFKGLEKFKGKWYHTSRFPHGGRRFHRQARRRGRHRRDRGAGHPRNRAAGQATHGVPAHRQLLRAGAQRQGGPRGLVKARKADYDGIVKRIRESFFGQEHYFIPKSVLEATPEEREREFDRMWDAGGFAFWLANYQDMFFEPGGQRSLRRLPQAQDPQRR